MVKKIKFCNMFRAFSLGLVLLTANASATLLTLENTFSLGSQLSISPINFNPTGLGYDSSTGELLYAQVHRGTDLYRSDLTGSNVSSMFVGTVPHPSFGSCSGYYNTAVAADANNYYFSNYCNNSGGYDVFSLSKTTGTVTQISSEIAASGGTPLDVRGGNLYRTEASTGYDYSNLDQIRVSSLSSPDTFTSTVTLAGSQGIADFAIDLSSNSVWTLDYLSSASIRRFDLSTGAMLDVFNLGLDGLTAGLTFANNKLYHYDHITGSSQLRVYNVAQTSSSVPESSAFLLMLLGLGCVVARKFERKN
ncbi:PEP-CTERM sorting domain-containing protein [Alteromonas sp. CYL-A6]|uniref:PEP-CTERM sorting domain-containing protein n=1 Tax=Alteromonas nitratireducens TaxID=3390813 RepID=UPI0034A957DA